MDIPAIGYDGLLRLTLQVTRNAADVEMAFRRAAFNVIAHNRDDHTKQHGFLMDRTGTWSLAPAFDLTFSNGPGGEHYLDVNGEARNPTLADLMALGRKHGIKGGRFAEFADGYGVSRRTANAVSRTLQPTGAIAARQTD